MKNIIKKYLLNFSGTEELKIRLVENNVILYLLIPKYMKIINNMKIIIY